MNPTHRVEAVSVPVWARWYAAFLVVVFRSLAAWERLVRACM